ncbi:MAG: toll/interleukin-1 receptor domain-containing protein, partial [Prochlorococcaceae cyanobacterium]
LQKLNIAFWRGKTMANLALTVLARAGVSDLDRRLFISYRRADTEPMAQQLFDALSRRTVSVVLDTVSVEPAVDFQARLLEQLADKSMVLVLHSPTFSQSFWAKQEVDYAIAHRLSLLIVRLPDLPASDVLRVSRRGDQLDLEAADLRAVAPGRPAALSARGLTRLVNTIMEVHDVELIRRAKSIRRRSLAAVRRHGLTASQAPAGQAIHLQGTAPSVSLLPTVRPPDVVDLHAASTADPASHGDIRIVVGHAANLPAERRAQMDWALAGRNVRYCDVTMLTSLLTELNGSTP